MISNNANSEFFGNRFELIPRTNVPEAFRGREETYRPWEAPPLLSANEDIRVADHQHDVNEMIMRLVFDHTGNDMPASVRSLVVRHTLPKDGTDINEYQGNHERSLMLLPQFELTNGELATHSKVDLGEANMQEIDSDFNRVGRRSAELALLRIIAGHRAEHIDPMMDELRVLMGAHFEESKPKKIRVVGFDDNFLRNERMQAIAIQYKKYHGELGDTGTEVAGRHTLVLRTDRASGFDPLATSVIQSAAQHDPTHIPKLNRVRSVFNEVIEEGPTHPFVAGAVIKLYMYNRGTAAEIDRRDRGLKKQELANGIFDSTVIHYRGPESP